MRKGYVVNVSVEDVKKAVEKALNAKGVRLPVINEFNNMANAEFPGLGYAWFNWRAKDDATTSVMIESRTSEGVETAYDLLFKVIETVSKEKESETNKAPEKTKTVKETDENIEVVEENPEQGALLISELGLKGNAAKAFAEASKAKTLCDVAKLSVADLEAMPGVGPKTIDKILTKMAEFGFNIK